MAAWFVISVPNGWFGFPLSPCQGNGGFQSGEAEDYCIVVAESSSVEFGNFDETFKVFPNPFKNTVSIANHKESSEKVSFKLRNIFGQVVFQNAQYQLNEELNLTDFASGIYFIELEKDGLIQTKKIVKE